MYKHRTNNQVTTLLKYTFSSPAFPIQILSSYLKSGMHTSKKLFYAVGKLVLQAVQNTNY